MNPKLTETIYVDFITSSPTTGAAADADSLPVCEVFEDATDTPIISPTVVKRTGKTGNYRVPIVCTAANGFEAAKSYNAVVSATVGSVAAKAVVRSFQVRTNSIDDPAILTAAYDAAKTAAPAGAAMTLTSAYDPAKTAATQASITTLTGYVDTEVAAILAAVDTEVAAIKAKTDNIPVDPADASDIAASFSTVNGSLTNIASKIDVVDDYIDTEVGAIKAKTDQLVFAGGRVDANATVALTAGDMNAIADALLKRDWNGLTGEAAHSALNAFRMLRNVWNTTGGTLSVKKEDGTTNAWTRTLTTDAAAQPITGAS